MVKYILIIFLLFSINCYTQNAIIIVETSPYSNQYNDFDKIKFQFNGNSFLGSDTGSHIIQIDNEIDIGFAIIKKDTFSFKMKFLNNETYILKPGCCCSTFILKSKNNAKKGNVSFKNKLTEDIELIVAEMNFDTIKQGHTKSIFSYESAMCLFKPSHIQIRTMDYNYVSYDDTNYKDLKKDNEKYILFNSFYHFLHGEKIEIIYDETLKLFYFKLNGYLSDEEHKSFFD